MWLDLKQTMGQEMRLSPRMIQSMEILTLPIMGRGSLSDGLCG